ncbi:hypothetical protein [Streptomyces fumanus]|uniref:Uncharacterized protein n=1 Tax=Streptomyces fumanus TaxID=67302 RepID=A0A919AGZ1_9ACTN|nr:hypothetical protein [Streptomyces fumanus]GHF07055.1 hypothetical protein GCM10018772_35020 [Streptomyces fumanus]
MSAEEGVHVFLDAELQDDHQLAGVVDVPLEERVDYDADGAVTSRNGGMEWVLGDQLGTTRCASG